MNGKAVRTTLVVGVLLLLGSLAPAAAQVSIGVGLPHVNIGINISVYPEFERVPGYPVYYAPSLSANYFFYDGMYYRWERDAPPHWGEHWGHDWEKRRHGWDQWDHSSTRRPAPLPVYQREYSGDRYPHRESQGALQSEHYPYRPRNRVVRHHYEAERGKGASAPAAPAQIEPQGPDQHRQQGQQEAPQADRSPQEERGGQGPDKQKSNRHNR